MQLDEACRRHGKESGIGGPLVLLSVWIWERFPVGRAKVGNYNPWNDHGRLDRRLQKKVTNWEKEHHNYVVMWDQECYKYRVGL